MPEAGWESDVLFAKPNMPHEWPRLQVLQIMNKRPDHFWVEDHTPVVCIALGGPLAEHGTCRRVVIDNME